jgi:hypothetical protein
VVKNSVRPDVLTHVRQNEGSEADGERLELQKL